jgi:hypothetical protein
MKILNKYRNKETQEIKEIWESKQEYENHKQGFDFEWEQI